MYKVLLVDDETINYQLFEKLVNWKEKGFDIAGTAGDGLEALQKYDEVHPDLIFMDIQLPLMDGLECVRCIREADKKVKIVIVSAYGDFSYAQKAIRYGVQDFLLKPVSRLMLNQIVDKIKAELEQEGQETGKTEFGTKERHVLEQLLRGAERAPQSLYGTEGMPQSMYRTDGAPQSLYGTERKPQSLYGTEGMLQSLDDTEVMQCLEKLQFCGVLFLDADGLVVSEHRYREMWESIKEKIKEKTGTDAAEYRLPSGFAVIFWEKGNPELVWNQIKIISAERNCICQIYCCKSQGRELAVWLNQFAAAENYGFYQKESGIHTLNKSPFVQEELSWQNLELLSAQAVTYGSSEGLLQKLTELFDEAEKKQIYPGILKELVLDIFVRIKFVLKKFDQQDSFLLMRNIRMEHIQNLYSMSALRTFATEKIRGTFAQIQNGFTLPGKNLVFRANAFTELSYREPDFSVQKVADYIGISKNYFTTQYKEQTGYGFWEYVTELRMEKAKEMLLTTEEMIGTIAREVGYESEYHFSRKFKEYTGQSPKNFRRNCRE